MRREDIKALLDSSTPPCVTVFVALGGRGVAGEEDRHRLAVLLNDSEGALRGWGASRREAVAIVAPGRRWLSEGPWPSGCQGLALYLAAGVSRRFGLMSPVADRVVVGERFLVGPLVGELGRKSRFWLLALSRNQPRLFRGDARELRPTGARLPTFDAVVAVDEAGPSLQYHRGGGGAARTAVTYHGHGGVKDADEERGLRWVGAVANQVDAVLHDQHAPLVLAGVAEQAAAYRRVCSYGNVLADAVVGSPDRRSEADLHAESWPLVEQQLDQARQHDLGRFQELAGTGWTVTDLAAVARAADEGRVEVLFAAANPLVDDEVVVDATIVAVWQAGGTVHLFDGPVPGGGPLGAILRYVTAPAAGSTPRSVEV